MHTNNSNVKLLEHCKYTLKTNVKSSIFLGTYVLSLNGAVIKTIHFRVNKKCLDYYWNTSALSENHYVTKMHYYILKQKTNPRNHSHILEVVCIIYQNIQVQHLYHSILFTEALWTEYSDKLIT